MPFLNLGNAYSFVMSIYDDKKNEELEVGEIGKSGPTAIKTAFTFNKFYFKF